jgi:hypothetical protein
MRFEKIAAGVKIGMRMGMGAHHSWGLAVRNAAATSMAATKQIRMAFFAYLLETAVFARRLLLATFEYINATLWRQQSQ